MATPTHLDGARVFRTALGKFGVGYDDAAIVALAIAQYEDNPSVTYVFACDRKWRVIGDLTYSSIDEAQRDAERYYEVSPIRWETA